MAYIGNVPAEKYTALTQQTFSSPTGTSFTLDQAVTNSVDIDLYIDNVKQNPASYSVSGTALTTSTISSPSTMYCIFNGRTTETVNPPDDSVGLSQMASATDGNLITFDASGNPAYVATGNDGQVLTSAGAGQPCLFEDAAGGGAWTLIGTAVASNSASLTITGLNSTYDTYAIAWSDMVPATDQMPLYMQMGDSSGIDTGGSDYSVIYRTIQTSGTEGIYTTASRGNIILNSIAGNASGEGVGGVAFLNRPGDGTTKPAFTFTCTEIDHSGLLRYYHGAGSRNSVIVLDRIHLFFDTGNITSGRMTVWGIAHA